MNRNNMLIEVAELKTKLGDPNVRIYDATIQFYIHLSREEAAKMPSSYDQYLQGHIPDTAFFDHEAFSDSDNKYMYMVLPEAELAEKIGEIGISAENEVIFYTTGFLPCATRAWWLLRYAGHDNVRVLNGGFSAWKEMGGEIELEPRQYAATKYDGQFRPKMFVGKEEVMTALKDKNIVTVNTLDLNSYQNGHITGSTNLPCGDIMQGWDAFLTNEEMAPRLAEEASHERIITYCGGGIAATVNAMAHLMVGNESIAVYDGSLDEWGGEKLPITTSEKI
jgi:thiosulfate/3-mercaptopyruvate sulfurtransferase